METSTEEIQNQLNVDKSPKTPTKFFPGFLPQKDKNREEKTRNMFYKNIHQKEIDNNLLTPKILKELVRKLS